ncbi:hypothetical protein [Aequorivita capsosiphonis]|uniref:hypothetical protein n=1 Tax=Aequorivita capsosiphonis TaxID=487317 RepID=UPI0004076B01|nr:hypothetical protein [Aequorivita capsosiphonis]
MRYTIKGKLQSAICDGNDFAIRDTKIRIYSLNEEQNGATALTAAQSKEVSQVFEENDIQKRSKQLLAETKTDASGNYEVTINDDKTKYDGGAVAVVLFYDEVPDYGQIDIQKPKNFKLFEVLLDVIQPKWRQEENGLVAVWNYSILIKVWCYILKRLDIWMICGTLRNCKSNAPLGGIEVIAMDDDIITDDLLGSKITDANGNFFIYYRSKDFKKTFLSPFINVETTPIFSFDNGPDVYFKYAFDSSEFFAENPSEAQNPKRKNVDNCLCVELCLPESPAPTNESKSAFYSIGFERRYGIVNNIDPATGRTNGKLETNWNNQAFYGNIMLLGSLKAKLNGQPSEYKFQYAQVLDPSILVGTIPESSWKDVIESDIAKTIIGTKLLNPLEPEIGHDNYVIGGTDAANSDGGTDFKVAFNDNWVVVPQTSGIHFGESLIRLKTTNLTGGEVDKSSLIAGNTSGPSLESNSYFALRMFRREANNPSTEIICGKSRPLAMFNTYYKDVPQGGTWDTEGKSTELGIATIDLQELVDGGSCSKIENTLRVNYTSANPNLGNVTVQMYGPGGPHSFEPVSYPSLGEEAFGSLNYLGSVAALPNCAFEVKLFAELNLTNGELQHRTIRDRVLYCKFKQD